VNLYRAPSPFVNFGAHLLASSALLALANFLSWHRVSATLLEPKICGHNSQNLTARGISSNSSQFLYGALLGALYTESDPKVGFLLRWLCDKFFVFACALRRRNGRSLQTINLSSRLAKFPTFESLSVYASALVKIIVPILTSVQFGTKIASKLTINQLLRIGG
jgi:hypothetical protein